MKLVKLLLLPAKKVVVKKGGSIGDYAFSMMQILKK
jgi:hypothetical protein